MSAPSPSTAAASPAASTTLPHLTHSDASSTSPALSSTSSYTSASPGAVAPAPPPGAEGQQHSGSSHAVSRPSSSSSEVDPTDSDACYKLFIGAIPEGVSEEAFRALFEPFGEIVDSVILHDRFTGASRGCGFVVYGSRAAADAAIAALADKARLPGAQRELIVRYAGVRPEENEFKLYVSMLSISTSEDDVRGIFSPFGHLSEVVVLRHKDESAQSKGSAFVKFSTKEAAERAIQALDRKWRDKNSPHLLQVRFAHTRDEKEAHFRQHPSPRIAPSGSGSPFAGGMSTSVPPPPFTMLAPQQMGGNALMQSLLQQQQMQQTSQHPHQTPHPQASSLQSAQLMRLMAMSQPPMAPSHPAHSHSAAPPHPHAPHVNDYFTPVAPASSHSPFLPSSHHSRAGSFGSGLSTPSAISSPAVGPSPPSTKDIRGPDGCNLFVYNIPEYFGEEQLSYLFGQYGQLLSVKVQRDRATHVSKGYGFASYSEPHAAQMAIGNLDGLILGGKKLTVRLKTPAQEAQLSAQILQHSQQHFLQQQQQQQQQTRFNAQQQAAQAQAQQQHSFPTFSSQPAYPARQPSPQHASMQMRSSAEPRASSGSSFYSGLQLSSPTNQQLQAAAGGFDSLAASLQGLNLSGASPRGAPQVHTPPSSLPPLPAPSAAAAFFGSSVAAHPQHASPSFDAVLQQAIFLQLQQQQQQQQPPVLQGLGSNRSGPRDYSAERQQLMHPYGSAQQQAPGGY